MKKLIALLVLIALFSIGAFAQVKVKTYRKKNGTVVQSHKRTTPNKTKTNNYSTKGNTNPYTRKKGTKKP